MWSSILLSFVAPVVGGSPVPEGKWPDVVVVVGEYGRCTGTLVAPDVVLTAAHCVDTEPTHVVTDTLDATDGVPGRRVRVKWARAYPDWLHRFDAAVLMLDHPALPRARPIATACLTNDMLADGAPLTVVGFGLVTSNAGDDNTRLHEAEVPVIDARCETVAGCEPMARPNGEFVAGGRGTDSCFGDSGGPAFLMTEDGPALAGIVSRGIAVPGLPCAHGGVYVRADKVVSWAQSVTRRRFARVGCARADDPELTDEEQDVGGCSGARTGAGASLPLVSIAAAGAAAGAKRRRRVRA